MAPHLWMQQDLPHAWRGGCTWGLSELGKSFVLQLQEKFLLGWSCGIAAKGPSRRRKRRLVLGIKSPAKGGWELKVSTKYWWLLKEEEQLFRIWAWGNVSYPVRNSLPIPSVLLSWALLSDLGAGPATPAKNNRNQSGSLVKSRLRL